MTYALLFATYLQILGTLLPGTNLTLRKTFDRQYHTGCSITFAGKRLIIIAEPSRPITAIRLATLDLETPFRDQEYWGTSLVYVPKGNCLYGTGSAGVVVKWEFDTGNVSSRGMPAIRGFSTAYDPQGKLLVVGSLGTLRIWNTNSSAVTVVLAHGSNDVSNLSISANGKLLATDSSEVPDATEDRCIRIWSLPTGMSRQNIPFEATDIEFLPDSRRICAIGQKSFAIFDALKGKQVWSFGGDFSAMAVNESGSIAAVGTSNGNVLLLDLERRVLLKTFEAHAKAVHAIAYDGATLVSWGEDNKMKVWDLDSPL